MAVAYQLDHAADQPGGTSVLVVRTPGFARAAYLPLVRALKADGADVWEIGFLPRQQTSRDYVEAIREVRRSLPDDLDVVAHGLGATLTLMAVSDLHPRRMFLLAPMLSVPHGPAVEALAKAPLGAAIDLRTPFPWRSGSLQHVVGLDLPLEVVSGPFAAEILAWRSAPIDLAGVDVPVWLGFSSGDDIATMEDSLPASRALPKRKIVRFGLNRFDASDFEHGDMLTSRAPIRTLVRAMR